MTSVFTCKHIGAGAPVQCAVHDAPRDETDSGWTLSCGHRGHASDEYEVADLDKLLHRDRSLTKVLGFRLYTVIYRENEHLPWGIEALGIPPEMQN